MNFTKDGEACGSNCGGAWCCASLQSRQAISILCPPGAKAPHVQAWPIFAGHLKTGLQVDLVPDGSLATGIKELSIPRKDWKLKHPRMERLWHKFSANGRG
jgi:hypothetical protein